MIDKEFKGGVMDLQKEKIAYEKHLLSQGVDFKYLPNIKFNELENIYELIEWDEEYSEALNEINSGWCTWQATKAQVVPDGFVLVNIDYLARVAQNIRELNNGEYYSEEIEENVCNIEAMIEAQEQSQ